jgi:choline dehydrogenase
MLSQRTLIADMVDYIVVGAGSAGCVIASEIVRRRLGRVLLLEAGDWPTSRNLKVPNRYPLAFSGPQSWRCASTPQTALSHRRIPLPTGKTLGGSSALNAMIYLRAHDEDLRRWDERSDGDWCARQTAIAYDAVEKKYSEENLTCPPLHPIAAAFLADWNQSYPRLTKLLAPQVGVGAYLRCQSRGRRISAWDVWLRSLVRSAISQNQIQVETQAQVQRVVIENRRVVGVQLAQRNRTGQEEVRCVRGVILCGGALNTPNTLVQSGIGPRSLLRELGLPCHADSANVGRNLQDHLLYPLVLRLRQPCSLALSSQRDSRWEYARTRSGPLASNIAEVGGFFCSNRDALRGPNGEKSDSCMRPDFQWHVTPTHYLEYPMRDPVTHAASIGVTLLRPKSRGEIRWRRSDALSGSTMEIDPRYHADADDEERLIDAVYATRVLLGQSAFANHFDDEILPGRKREQRDQVAHSIRRWATTLYHYAGTCAFGDDAAVLDRRLSVRGLDRLWVCDASAMPCLVSANPQATVMMMAYRFVDWLQDAE